MDCVLEHEVDKVGVWLHKLVQLLQILQLSSLLLVKDVEVVFACVKLHILKLGRNVGLLLGNLLVTLLQLLLLFLEGANLFVDLLLHH